MRACGRCGQENPDGFRFCGACGAELAAPPAHEVRKTVTVVFADVTGSTSLGERLDPEAMRHVMSRYFAEMQGALERHGGTVEKFIGDAVMAVFGIPRLHEDDALRALRATAAMRDRLAFLNDELEREFGVRLDARIGVNTGEVVTGDAASGERLATGDAVNVAARLEQAAEPGQILLGEQTRRLARGAIEVERVEPLTLKGKSERFVAHRLLRVLEGAPAFERRLDAPLVGRGNELARVREAFAEAVSERRCRLVTVLGPPGIGKSRLAREIAGILEGQAEVLFGRCLPYGEGITYWPLREIFAAAGAEDELTAALEAPAPEEVFWAVRQSLERRARERPLALFVDDVHWAEPTLVNLIEHLADWTRDAPLLLVCLGRPEILDSRAWGGGQRDAETLTLEPLSEAESDQLIGELLGSSHVDDQTRARIREVAEGNPLFVEQLLAMFAEGGRLERVPPTIQALLAARLDALPNEERELLERASVVGLEFEWEALAELDPDRRRPPGTRLAALVRKELIRPHDVIEDTFSFRHMLIRDAAYDRLPKELRADLHERFAGWLDGRGEEFEEIVGYHLEQAHRSLTDLGPGTERSRRLADQAAERLAAAGTRAFARADMPAAANLLERATGLLPADDRRRLNALPSLGRALIERGEWERADTVLSEASERARAVGERGVAADAAVALAFVRLHTDPESTHEKVRRELDEAIRVFEELGDEGGLAQTLHLLGALGLAGALRLWRGETMTAVDELERAAHHADAAGDRAQEVESLHFLLVAVLRGPIPVASALARVDDVARRARGHRRLEVTILFARAQLEAMQGRFAEARELIAEAESSANELGLQTILAAGVLRAAGEIELLAGEPAAAERALRPACEALERMGDWAHLASVVPGFADALYAQGRGAEAVASIELARRWTLSDDMDAQIGLRRVRAKLLAEDGEFARAERVAQDAVELAAQTDFVDLHAKALADLAEVRRLADRAEEAAAALEEAIRLHERKGNVVAAQALRARLGELSNVV